jgi:ferredoxin
VSDAGAVAEFGSIEPGDTIVAVGSGLGDVVNTEAADYDATASAILEVAGSHDEIVLVVKRMVRRRVAQLTAVLPSGEQRTIVAYHGENVRMALLRQGVLAVNDGSTPRYDGKSSGNCGGNGLCCTCVVSVLSGAEHLNERTSSEKQLLRKVARWRQSCKAKVQIRDDAAADEIAVRVQLAPRGTAG